MHRSRSTYSRMPCDAIFADTDVPDDEEEWIDRNVDESIDAEIAEVTPQSWLTE